MSAAHHGDSELMRRFIDQIDGTAKREYPAGRMGHEDDGALAMAFVTDPVKKVVVIRFGKPVEWIGLGPDECVEMAQQLVERAREISDKPVTFRIR